VHRKTFVRYSKWPKARHTCSSRRTRCEVKLSSSFNNFQIERKRKKEKQRKESRGLDSDEFMLKGHNDILGPEGSQAVPIRPSAGDTFEVHQSWEMKRVKR
jgi:hypothetical protein